MILNPKLSEIKDYQYVLNAVQPELDTLTKFIKEQHKEPLVSTATLSYGLPRWEKSNSINPVNNEQSRRANIESKLKNNQPLTLEWLSTKLNSYASTGTIYGYSLNYIKQELHVFFTSTTTTHVDLIYQELRRLVPANMLLEVSSSITQPTEYHATTIYREYRKEEI